MIKRHLVEYPDAEGVTTEAWFESYGAAMRTLGMLHDAEYIGARCWPPPLGIVPVSDEDLMWAA